MSQRSKLTTIMLTTAGVMVASLMAILFMGIATTKANRELLRDRIVIDQLRENPFESEGRRDRPERLPTDRR